MLTAQGRKASSPMAATRIGRIGGERPRWRAGAGAFARWLAAWVVAMAATLVSVVATLHAPPDHLAALTRYLLVGGVVSVTLSAAAVWLTSGERLAGVRVKFALPALLTAFIISFNLLLVARGMFLSQDDTVLVLDMLVFGVIVALAVAASIAGAVAGAIRRVESGARRIAGGEYGARLPEDGAYGSAELARLARWFNQMAASVEDAFRGRDSAEQERRQIVAAVSHDLRTPLASIQAMVEAITDGVVSDPGTVARYQRTIRSEVRHLAALIDDLFELSRLESTGPEDAGVRCEPASLDDLISDTLEAMHGQAAQCGIELTGSIEGDLPAVVVDARRIHRVLANLAQNAVRHTPRGGRIVIHARLRQRTDGRMEALVRVVDSGEGIAPRDLPHVFEPMYRGEPSRMRVEAREVAERSQNGAVIVAGAGLGLAIAQRLVEAHGGQMWAESPLGPEAQALLGQGVSNGASAAQPAERQQRPGVSTDASDVRVRGLAGGGADQPASWTQAPGTCVSFTLPVQPATLGHV